MKNQPREISVILEEISDLSEYLDGLPKPVRSSGAFESYELRLSNLEQEYSERHTIDLSNSLIIKHKAKSGFRKPLFKISITGREEAHRRKSPRLHRENERSLHRSQKTVLTANFSLPSGRIKKMYHGGLIISPSDGGRDVYLSTSKIPSILLQGLAIGSVVAVKKEFRRIRGESNILTNKNKKT